MFFLFIGVNFEKRKHFMLYRSMKNVCTFLANLSTETLRLYMYTEAETLILNLR
jgi:hypothetical protein